MIQIEVPDWVVEAACKNAWPQFRSGMETEIWEFADAARRDRLREITHAAINATLGAWVVPTGTLTRRSFERFMSSSQGSQAMFHLSAAYDDDVTLYTLRQEKPE